MRKPCRRRKNTSMEGCFDIVAATLGFCPGATPSSPAGEPRTHPAKRKLRPGPSMTDGRSTASLHRSGRPVHHILLAARQTTATADNDVVGEAERDGAGGIEAGDLLFGQANIEC